MDEVCTLRTTIQTNQLVSKPPIVPDSINIFVWAVALLSHAACKSFGALFAVRFILGMCEGPPMF